MNRLTSLLAIVLVIAAFAACKNVEEEKKKKQDAQKTFMDAEAKARTEQDAIEKKKAIDDATKGCDAGTASSCIALGRIHQEGKDAALAVTSYARACAAKDAGGCRLAAETAPDATDKLVHYKALCALDDVDGCLQGAQIADKLYTSNAIPTPKRIVDADSMTLLLRACQLGQPIACTARGVGLLVKNDARTAAESFSLACDKNEPRGCVELSKLWKDGTGVKKKDKKKAAALMKKACAAGLQEAC